MEGGGGEGGVVGNSKWTILPQQIHSYHTDTVIQSGRLDLFSSLHISSCSDVCPNVHTIVK